MRTRGQRRAQRWVSFIAGAFALLLVARPADAQDTLVCVSPPGCVASERVDPTWIVLQLRGVARPFTVRKGVKIVFVGPGGALDSTLTDSLGIARVLLRGDQANALGTLRATAFVGATVVSQAISVGRPVTFELMPRREPHWYDRLWAPEHQWYVSNQRKESIGALLTVASGDCRRNGIVFHAYGDGATAWPDTAWGEIGPDNECWATGRMKLGSTVGTYLVRATLVGDKTQHRDVATTARALPWVGLGIAYTGVSHYVTLSAKRSPLKVTRKFVNPGSSDTLEVSYDSTRTGAAVIDSSRAQQQFTPVVGVDFPLILRLKWLRLFVGADVNHPTNDWFMGASLLQITGGFEHEAVGVDLHVVGQLSRRDVLADPARCATDPNACKTDPKTGFVGGGVVLAVSAGSVFEKLYSALIPK